jgi:chitinase
MENLTFIGLSTNEMGYARASIHTTPHLTYATHSNRMCGACSYRTICVTCARFNLVSLQAAVQYLRSKELAKFVDAEASDSVFRDNSPLKSLGNAIFTRHSSFFSSPSAAASSADAPPYSGSGAGAQSESTAQQEKPSTYRISALTDDDSFPPPAASSSASSHVASSYSLTSVYGSTPSPSSSASPSPASHPSPSSAEVSSPSSGGAPPRLHYRSLSSLFPSFGRGGRRADKSDSMPAASFTSSSSSTSSSATSSSRSPYERVSPRSSSSTSSSSSSSSPVPPLSMSAHSLSSSSSYTGGSRRGGATSDRTHHGPAHARSSSSATLPDTTPGSFAAWATPVQRPPAVITLDGVATKKGASNGADDLGDFLTQLQNVKDDALSSQG